jgi:uncharacterized membrane protein YdjX (TVP38/TMEM64 family)
MQSRSTLAVWTLVWTAILALILVPFFLWEEAIFAWVRELLDRGRAQPYLGLLLAAVLAGDILLPVPSSLVSTAAGVLLGFAAGTLVSLAGMTAGCALGYALGRFARAGLLDRIVGPDQLGKATASAARWGDWAVVICRPVPVLAEATVVVAGLTRRPWTRFLLLTTLANLGVSAAYALVGAYSLTAGSFLLAFAGALGIPALAWGLLKLARSRQGATLGQR